MQLKSLAMQADDEALLDLGPAIALFLTSLNVGCGV